ncbi:thioredoxin 1 [Kushneria sinocarnis]|uniref:Thioredoxin 1 n=1 Tax=Kushneria sinocarnis TaxID=595502 RepID=A0A420WVY1_9GAMM|nr:thioredoxin family protein [Kushneria sinocarnis]RKR03286.1 thioredoxin 1 [Kushneria sinocarnis]
MQTFTLTTPDEFDALLADHELVLVDFFKDNCPGCKMLDMALKRFAAGELADSVALVKVQLEVVGEEFFHRHSLRQTPTLLLFRSGEEVGRLTGFNPPEKIEALVAAHLESSAV